jgi:hypothetical protein
MGVAARLVMNPPHHTAALKGQQGAVDLFGHHRPPPTAAPSFGDRDPCSAGRGGPFSGRQHLSQLGAQLFGAHDLIAVIARR